MSLISNRLKMRFLTIFLSLLSRNKIVLSNTLSTEHFKSDFLKNNMIRGSGVMSLQKRIVSLDCTYLFLSDTTELYVYFHSTTKLLSVFMKI